MERKYLTEWKRFLVEGTINELEETKPTQDEIATLFDNGTSVEDAIKIINNKYTSQDNSEFIRKSYEIFQNETKYQRFRRQQMMRDNQNAARRRQNAAAAEERQKQVQNIKLGKSGN